MQDINDTLRRKELRADRRTFRLLVVRPRRPIIRLSRKEIPMAYAITVESAIRDELISRGPCTLEALVQRLSQFSWNEVFAAIDQLSRDGRLVLRHPTRFDYEVSIGLTQPDPELSRARWDAEGGLLWDHRDRDSQWTVRTVG